MKIKKIGKNISLMIIGGLIFGGVTIYAETLLPSNQVIYDNSNSGSYSDTVQGALDELYARQGMYDDIRIIDNTIYFNTEYIGSHPVYFNPTTGEKCNNYIEANSKTEVKNGCMKWYAYSQNQNGTINMILDHNTTTTITWNEITEYRNAENESKEVGILYPYGIPNEIDNHTSNTRGPLKLLKQLKIDTNDWQGVNTRTDSYRVEWTYNNLPYSYIISYDKYKARLISAEEIEIITKSIEKPQIQNIIIHNLDDDCSSKCTTGQNKYRWLFDNTKECTSYGCNKDETSNASGYWTSSPKADNHTSSWMVYYNNTLNSYGITYNDILGIRPVITVSKNSIF